jgi:site-specific recombinase XerD
MARSFDEWVEYYLSLPSVSKENRTELQRFSDYLRMEGKRPATIKSSLEHLTLFARASKKPFKKVTETDLVEYMAALSSKKATYRYLITWALRSFFVWFYKEPEPAVVKRLKMKRPQLNLTRKDASVRISVETKNKLVAACNLERHQNLLEFLWEAGARRGEVCEIRVRDVKFDASEPNLTTVFLPSGKTGSRTLYLVESTPYLIRHLKNHPLKSEPDAPFFYSIREGKVRKLHGENIRHIIRLAALRAGIKRNIHPHLFRYSAASRDSGKLAEPIMCKKYGWSPYSKMPRHYALVGEEDYKERVRELQGLKRVEGKAVERVSCPFCNILNEPGAERCMVCNGVMNPALVREARELEAERWKKTEFEVSVLRTQLEQLIDVKKLRESKGKK